MYNEKAAVYRMLMAVIEGGRKGKGNDGSMVSASKHRRLVQ